MNSVDNLSLLNSVFHEMVAKHPKLATSIFLQCIKGEETPEIAHIKHTVKELKTKEGVKSIKLFAKAVKDICDQNKDIKQDDIPTMLLLVESSRKSLKKLKTGFSKDVEKMRELGNLTSALSDLSKTIKGLASQQLEGLYPPGAAENAPVDTLREKHYRLGKELLQNVSSAKKATKLQECLSFEIRDRLNKMITNGQRWGISLPPLPSPLPIKLSDLTELEKRIKGSYLEFMQEKYTAAIKGFDAWAADVHEKGKFAYVDDIIDTKRQEIKKCKMDLESLPTTVSEYTSILLRAKGQLNSVTASREQREKRVRSALQELQRSHLKNSKTAKQLEKKGTELLGHLRDPKRRLSELEADIKEVDLYIAQLYDVIEPKRPVGVPQSQKDSDANLLIDDSTYKFRKQKLS
jgi:hypothetical protein